MVEQDPTGRGAHEPGSKLDAGKLRVGLVLGGFAQALREVSMVGTYGAEKYTDNGLVEVPDGISRYTDAMLRHYLAEAAGERFDDGSDLLHAAHVAWNAPRQDRADDAAGRQLARGSTAISPIMAGWRPSVDACQRGREG